MHSRSRHVFLRLRYPTHSRTATTATKPEVCPCSINPRYILTCHCPQPLPTRSSGTPPTLSPNKPPPDIGKWGRPQGFLQHFSDVGSSPPSRTSAPAFRDRRARGPARDDSESRHDHRPKYSRTSPDQTTWKRPPPFPMLPAGSNRPPRSLPRDTPPHIYNSVIHPVPSPSTAARPRRATREPKRYVENVRSVPEKVLAEETPFEGEIPYPDHAFEVLKESRARRSKVAHKERGSLRRTFRDDGPSSLSRKRDRPTKVPVQNSKPKGKPRALNETKVEVFIPSIVSVGNLSRILRVSLGAQCITRESSEYSLLD
jgi:hypothetical protein